MSQNPHFRLPTDEQGEPESSHSVGLMDNPRTATGGHTDSQGGYQADSGLKPNLRQQPAAKTPAAPFSSALESWQSGCANLVAGGAILAGSAFLVSQIATTPALAVQMGLLAGIGVIAGLVLLMRGVRKLVVRLSITPEGIAVVPAVFGFQLEWSNLRCWALTHTGPYSEGPAQLKLWKEGGSAPILVELSLLKPAARQQLCEILAGQAPQSETL